MVIAVIAFGSVWPVLLNTIAGFAGLEPRLREVASSLELNRYQYLTKFALPGAAPDIIAGLRLGLTLALILCIVAEMMSMAGGSVPISFSPAATTAARTSSPASS